MLSELASSLPSTDEEVWRYSRIGELDLSAFQIADPPASASVPDPVKAVLAEVGDRAATVVTVDGHVVSTEVDPAWSNKGLAITTGGELVGSVMTDPLDVFAARNAGLCAMPVTVSVPDGVEIGAPVVVAHWLATDGVASFPRLVVRTGVNAEATVVDLYLSADITALTSPVVELDAAQDSRLGYLAVQDLGSRVWQIGSQISRAGQQATVTAAAAAFGGDYARTRTDAKLEGKGATGNLLAVYFGDGSQTLDFRTFQDHRAPNCTSDLLFKGAVDDASSAVYTGLIKVRPGATGTNAFQTNRNIKLGEESWALSVPNLEIENNDVKCSHATTVGPIDEEQRFYIESRGVPPEVAEQLVVRGFFADVIERLPTDVLNTYLARRIDQMLQAHGSSHG